MKLYHVLQKAQEATKKLREEMHRQRRDSNYHLPVRFPAPTPLLVTRDLTDGYLLELIYKELTDLKELRSDQRRIQSDTVERTRLYRDAIASELPELAHLLEEEWELR